MNRTSTLVKAACSSYWLLAGWLAGAPGAAAQPAPGAAWCGTAPPTAAERARVLREVVPLERQLAARGALANHVTYLPLRIHILRETNGAGGTSEADIFASIAGTNQLYRAAHIQLYVCGPLHYINNSAWYDMSSGAVENDLCTPNDDPNAINVYYAHSITSGGNSVCGYSYVPGNRALLACNNTHVLAHELGHALGLPHPQQDGNHPVVSERELVRRTNCTAKGDQICDTPADPFDRPGATQTNCVYTGTITDANGDRYAPLMANTMNYWQCGGDALTPGQSARMEATRLAAHAARTCAELTPAAPTQLTAAVVPYGGGVALRWTDNAADELGYFVERASGANDEFAAIATVPADGTAYADATPPALARVRYRVKPINAAGAFSNEACVTADVTYCATAFTGNNCPPAGLPIYLDEVQILRGTTAVLSNAASGCGTYASFITRPAVVQAGSTYTLQTRIPTLPNGSIYPQIIYAWADFNHNGSFADPGELLCQGPSQYNLLSAPFTIPATAPPGWMRLRVRSQSDFYPALGDACATGVYGETEDYTLLIPGEITGTGVARKGPGFTLFPNPASAGVPPAALLTDSPATGPTQLRICNLLGQAMTPALTLRPNVRTDLPVRGLAAGLYVVRVLSPAGESQQRLVLY
ncbi:GEVED domain-containing protein [Hymenobacter sp.]|uniref:GEVED domain-containing protein n=1 Tax=Hymenobacter sp. TaxID=1898978 RepID=UPI00286BAE9E|nr:GEVED domain-containing protein [Hymenobacter sp.]